MKKFIFAIGTLSLYFSAAAQCGEQGTQITNSCGSSGRYSVQIRLTGSLKVDNALIDMSGGTMKRKPNTAEIVAILNALEDNC